MASGCRAVASELPGGCRSGGSCRIRSCSAGSQGPGKGGGSGSPARRHAATRLREHILPPWAEAGRRSAMRRLRRGRLQRSLSKGRMLLRVAQLAGALRAALEQMQPRMRHSLWKCASVHEARRTGRGFGFSARRAPEMGPLGHASLSADVHPAGHPSAHPPSMRPQHLAGRRSPVSVSG